jgi:uncharacterized cupredoxin-like copper-binding protein
VVPGAREIAVTGRSFAFEPAQIQVAAGEDVTIALDATDTLHDFTLPEGRAHIAASPGNPGRGGLRVDRPGTYTAFCAVPGHREAGMQAQVVVQ